MAAPAVAAVGNAAAAAIYSRLQAQVHRAAPPLLLLLQEGLQAPALLLQLTKISQHQAVEAKARRHTHGT